MGKGKAANVTLADRLLTSDQIATRLGCSRETIYELVAQGLPHLRLGQGPRAEYRFIVEAVLSWLRDCASMNSVPAAPKPRIPQDLFEERMYIGRSSE